MANSMAVADYIINYANKVVRANSPMHYQISNPYLQPLLFYLDLGNILINKRPLFKDTFTFSTFGPYLQNVYNEYKSFNGHHIPYTVKHLKSIYTDSKGCLRVTSYRLPRLTSSEKNFSKNELNILLQVSPFGLIFCWQKQCERLDKQHLDYNLHNLALDFHQHPFPVTNVEL